MTKLSPAEVFKFNDQVRRLVGATRELAVKGGLKPEGRDVQIYNSWHKATRQQWTQLGVLAGGVLPVDDRLIYAVLMQLHKASVAQCS